MVINDKLLRYCLIFGLAGATIVLGIAGFRAAQAKYERAMVSGKELAKIAEKIDYIIHFDELNHWQREEWEIDTFFHTPAATTACEYISSKDTAGLNNWILAGGDVNLTGDHGITLLFWAMLDRNEEAFQALLSHGADPAITLSDPIALKCGRYMYKGDSVLFAAEEFHEFDLMLAALPFLSNPNQTCIGDLNLISRLTESNLFFDAPPYVFAEMIRSGVNPNVREGRDGFVPAVSLIAFNRTARCLAMLVAGADPTFQTAAGNSVVSIMRKRFENHDPVTATADFQTLAHWLIDQGYLEPEILKVNPSSSTTLAKP